MTTKDFFNQIAANGQKMLASNMTQCEPTIELQPNQRITKDRYTDILWLEEKRKWKDPDGQRHNCWVRIAIIK